MHAAQGARHGGGPHGASNGQGGGGGGRSSTAALEGQVVAEVRMIDVAAAADVRSSPPSLYT
jgi:hypothetical protein